MLKKSYYNVVLNDSASGKDFLYNSRSSAFAALDTFKDYYKTHDSFDPEDQEHQEEISKMQANGFAVEDGTDEIKIIDLIEQMSRFNSSQLNLTIAPTLWCNFDCPYCYEQKNGHRMNEETQNLLIEFVSQQTKRIRSLFVTWYGGEPLLEMETIRKLSEKFISVCKENNVSYSASVVTNGYYLTKENDEILNECQVRSAQVTNDGYKETNNQRRHSRDGKDTFSVIVQNVDQAKDVFPISVRINVDKTNKAEVEKLLNFYEDTMHWDKSKNVNIYPAQVTDSTGKYTSCLDVSDYSQFNEEFNNQLYAMKGKEILGGIYPRQHISYCSALSPNSYVIDPDGYFYKCWEEIGIEKYRVGSLKDGAKFNPYYVQWLSLQVPKECHDCKFRPICGGGCPFKRMERGNLKQCDIARYTLPAILKLVYKSYMEEKNRAEVAEKVQIH
jgi:uncharacterized protein